MYYFDGDYLLQYLKTRVDLRVYVNGEYLDISSADDVLDPDVGHGYTIYGKPREFDYREIDHILVNGHVFTLEDLQKELNQEDEPEKEKDSKSDDSDAEKDPEAKEEEPSGEEEEGGGEKEAPAEDDEEEEETPPKEAVYKSGDYVTNIDPSSKYWRTNGSIILAEGNTIVYRYWKGSKFRNVFVHPKQIKKVTDV